MPFLRHFAMGVVMSPLARPAVRATLRAGMSIPSLLIDAWSDVRAEAERLRAESKTTGTPANDFAETVESLRGELAALRDELKASRKAAQPAPPKS